MIWCPKTTHLTHFEHGIYSPEKSKDFIFKHLVNASSGKLSKNADKKSVDSAQAWPIHQTLSIIWIFIKNLKPSLLPTF